VKGKERKMARIVATRSLHELSQAIREAFDAARRQLEDCVREQRHAVKVHLTRGLNGHAMG
jgi:hypothetical protein